MAKSRVACASFNIGTNTTITITRDVKTYTHTITYKFGSATGTIATKTTQTSIVWSPTASTLYAQIPNAVSGYGTITCETFNGSTSLGTTTAGFYAYAVKSNCLPTVTATIVDTNATSIALTGSNTKLICYLSKPKVTLTATAKNSATIKSTLIHNYGGGLTATTTPYTFDTVLSKEFRCTATDSRGYSTTTTYNVPFVAYEPCHFTTVPTIKRTESTSTTATLTVKGYCFKGSFGVVNNELALKYRYKTSTGAYGSYAYMNGATWNTDGTFTATVNVSNLSLSEQYAFEVIAQDKLTSFGDGEEILLTQGIGDLRIGKDYVMTKNNLIAGDKDNEDWRCFKARRKRDGINYDANFGAGFTGGGISAVMEVNQIQNGEETKLARYDLRKDGYLYNYFSNMSVAEIMSYAPSIVAGGQRGNLLLNGGNSNPILFQWGRVSITPTAANTVTKSAINFDRAYQGVPAVFTELSTSAPSTMSISAGDITASGFNIYLQRANTTATSIMWWAIGNGTQALPE
jgi:hypothetical protein